MAKAKRRTVGEVAWIGAMLSVVTLSEQRGRLRLDKNSSDLGLIEALEKHIGGSVSGGGHHGEGYAPQIGESRERTKWFYGDEEDIVNMIHESWDWMSKTAQAKARKLRVAKPRKRRR